MLANLFDIGNAASDLHVEALVVSRNQCHIDVLLLHSINETIKGRLRGGMDVTDIE